VEAPTGRDLEDAMPMFMKWDGKEPEDSTPSVSEITVTKLVDSSSLLFDQGEFFISDGTMAARWLELAQEAETEQAK
jgi:hypothetical protein